MAQDLLSCMRSFAAVVEHKGFAAAARHLRLSTSVITKHIQTLERHLGKPLLLRTTRHLEPTEAGRVYALHVAQILSQVADAQHTLQQLESEPHGTVQLGACGMLDTADFAAHLQQFLQRYPKITVNVHNDASPVEILNGRLDLVTTEDNFPSAGLIKEQLFTVSRRLYASPAYFQKHGKPKTIADLAQHNCMVYTKVSPDHIWLLGTRKVKVKGNYTSNSALNFLQTLYRGVGIAWCSETLAQEDLKSGRLEEAPLDVAPIPIPFFLYYRPGHSQQPAILLAKHISQFHWNRS